MCLCYGTIDARHGAGILPVMKSLILVLAVVCVPTLCVHGQKTDWPAYMADAARSGATFKVGSVAVAFVIGAVSLWAR